MKIRSINELQEAIDEDIAWRKHELTNLRNLTQSAKGKIQKSLTRCAIMVLYSHWEGFVKKAAQIKIIFLSTQGYKYNELANSFSAFAALTEFKGNIPTAKFEAIVKLTSGLDLNQSMPHDAYKQIDAKSNLNSDTLKEIALKTCINYDKNFQLKENLIDSSFLNLRNKIAHGERVDVEFEDFDNLYQEITALMNLFKNLTLNSISEQSFLKKESIN